MQFPFITSGMALNIRQYNDKTLLIENKIYEYASELRKFSHFHILKLISFNILLVLMILCLRNIYFQVSNYICIIINAVSFYKILLMVWQYV